MQTPNTPTPDDSLIMRKPGRMGTYLQFTHSDLFSRTVYMFISEELRYPSEEELDKCFQAIGDNYKNAIGREDSFQIVMYDMRSNLDDKYKTSASKQLQERIRNNAETFAKMEKTK